VTEPLHERPTQGSFMEIKKTLDPGVSYLIFENDLTLEKESIFDPSHMAYAYFEANAFAWKKVVDKSLQREYLVVCIGTGNEDEVLGQVMGFGFPSETVYYLYKATEV
jgi:hypothetical protein